MNDQRRSDCQMYTVLNELSYRSQRLARAILRNETDQFALKYGHAKPTPKDLVTHLLAWLAKSENWDVCSRLSNECGDSWENSTLSRFHKSAERFGFHLLGRFPSLIEGDTISVYGRVFDYAFFLVSSTGTKLKSVVFNGKISDTFNPLPAWFSIGDGLTLFLELDAMFMPRRKAILGVPSQTVLAHLETTLLTYEEINAFYRGRVSANGEFCILSTDSRNLANFGKSRAAALPREWRS